jgi:hypothetical protein
MRYKYYKNADNTNQVLKQLKQVRETPVKYLKIQNDNIIAKKQQILMLYLRDNEQK